MPDSTNSAWQPASTPTGFRAKLYPRFLFHPHVTLAATITALGGLGLACGSFALAIDPLPAVPGLHGLRHFVDHSKIVLYAAGAICTALSGICTTIAGLGRSFAPMIDMNRQPK